MRASVIPGGIAAAAAGAAMMIVASSAPASAFTLSSPSLTRLVLSANIEHVWWDRRGRWHPNHPYWGWRPWYRPYYRRPYYHPWRRCWWTWYGRVCRWY